MSYWIVEHDLIGWCSVVTDVTEVPVPEIEGIVPRIKATVRELRPGDGVKPMRFTKLEATLLARQLEDEFIARCRAEHPDNDDWLSNCGVWYASEVTK